MRVEVEVPKYSKENGLQFVWERGFVIEVQKTDNSAIIRANSEGLVSLARHLLLLSQAEVPEDLHIHLDETNSLEDGSCELIVAKI